MNHQLAGALFLLFGMSLLGNSIADLSNNFVSIMENIKSIIGVALGISSCIYGYKRMKNDPSVS